MLYTLFAPIMCVNQIQNHHDIKLHVNYDLCCVGTVSVIMTCSLLIDRFLFTGVEKVRSICGTFLQAVTVSAAR